MNATATATPSTTATQPLIALDAIKKVFFTDEVETHALAGVHFSILPGEYVSISGPSGCGKSTLLSILGLLDTPTEGRYQLNGTAVEDINANERARIRNREIGFIFQAFNLIEITKGLNPGDQVVLSDTTAWDAYDRIRLN